MQPTSQELSSTDVWQSNPTVVRKQRRVLYVLMAMQALGSFGMGAAPSVGILLAEEVMGTEALAGIARTMLTLGAAAFGIPLALMAMRFGRRIALSLGWAIAAIGASILVFAAWAQLPVLLIGGMLLFGAGTAVGLQSRFAATDMALPAKRGRSLSFVVWCGSLGAILGPNLGGPGRAVSNAMGLPLLAGAFVIAFFVLALTAILTFLLLRPDPLLHAMASSGSPGREGKAEKTAVKKRRSALATIWATPGARVGLISVVSSQVIMVSLMTMTPVHMGHEGASLEFIGITISIHVAGMYALAPIMGYVCDRIGSVRSIFIAQGLFILTGIAGIYFGGSAQLMPIPLLTLGIAWSLGNVAGSVALTASVAEKDHARVQGFSDTLMNAGAAIAAFVAGPLLVLVGFSGLSAIAIVVAGVTALTCLAARRTRSPAVSA